MSANLCKTLVKSLFPVVIFAAILFPVATAMAAATLSLQSLSPSTSVSVNTTVSFHVVASGFSNPSFYISDSFGGGTISSQSINSAGYFSWVPESIDVGTHNLTITVTDSSGNTASVAETITVNSAPTLLIQSLNPSTSMAIGTPLSFTAVTSGFTNPSYSLNDSFTGGTISNADINSSGNFNWTPQSQDIGTHGITVTAIDPYGHIETSQLIIMVGATSPLTVSSISPGTTINPGQPLSFVAAAPGFINPSFSVSDSFSGSTISSADINSSGDFNWTPAQSDLGTHNLTLTVNGDGRVATAYQTITVNGINIENISPGKTVAAGTTLTFTVDTYGLDSPTFSLGDSFLGNSLSTGDVDTSGNFTWTPTLSDIGTHTITMYANDSSGNSDNTSVVIAVVSPGSVIPPTPVVSTSCPAGDLYNPSTGAQCVTTPVVVSTCPAGDIYNPLTGTPCTTTSAPVSTVSASVLSQIFSEYLAPGSSDSQVTALQTLLTREGFFNGPITGYYGDLTTTAVENFQTAHDIDSIPLGVVGPATRSVLNSLGATTVSSSTNTTTTANDGYKFNNPLNIGSVGTDVTELQKRLTAESVYSGPITGYYGSLTQAAVEKFQTAHDLTPLGNVGPGTRALLNSGV